MNNHLVKLYTALSILILISAIFFSYPLSGGDEKKQNEQELKLENAKKVYFENPGSIDALIWVGRRTAYLGRYKEAIDIYSKGIKKFPDNAWLFRHRGHRFITLRQPDNAVGDLEHAAKLIKGTKDVIEADGMPNKKNIPLSTLHSNVWYHLGLAYYLKGDLENALDSYRECMKVSKNDDMKAATSHWLYMTLRLLGEEKEAESVLTPITKNMSIIENIAYYRLLLFYKGLITREELLEGTSSDLVDPAVIYGLGNWYYYNGDKESAFNYFKQLVIKGNRAAFGFIAAEAQLKRM